MTQCVFVFLRSTYLVAGEDESCPHKEARHSLSGGDHEEGGLVLDQQRRFRDPRRRYSWQRAGHCRGRKTPSSRGTSHLHSLNICEDTEDVTSRRGSVLVCSLTHTHTTQSQTKTHFLRATWRFALSIIKLEYRSDTE